MAIRKPCETITLVAAADLSDNQYKFVYQSDANAATAAVDAQNGATGNVYIQQNAPASGEAVECAVPGGQSLLYVADASAAVGAGLMISTGSAGTARVGANKYIRATVDEAVTAANQLVVVNFVDPIFVTT